MHKKISFSFALFLISLFLCFCGDKNNNPDPGKTLPVSISILVNNAPISFDAFKYTNAVGDSFEVRKFKFFLSNFELRNSQTGAVFKALASYHLINGADPNSLSFSITRIPDGTYDQLFVAIGVDSAANLSLNQVGDLTPSSDMAWDWETGYKFILLEGTYKSVGGKRGGLVFHVGENEAFTTLGFTTSDGAIQTLDFTNKHPHLNITAHVDELFAAPNPIAFDSLNSTMSLRSGGRFIVQNYAEGFISASVSNR